MKKSLLPKLLLLLSFSLFASPMQAPAFTPDDDDVIEIDVNSLPATNGPKRTPAISPISAACHVNLSFIEVNFLFDLGDVDIVVTNLSSGSSSAFNVHSSIQNTFIPFVFTPGYHTIVFTTSAGAIYSGCFVI